MLRGISPLLHADLLHALASMGHGDEIVIADANFPSASVGRRLLHVATTRAADALDAVLSLLPLDTFAPPAAFTMQVVGDASATPEPVREFAEVLARRAPDQAQPGSLARDAFYVRARSAFAVVRTADVRPYGNILLVKGTIHGATVR
jgi:L-fucose mutarotase